MINKMKRLLVNLRVKKIELNISKVFVKFFLRFIESVFFVNGRLVVKDGRENCLCIDFKMFNN